MLKEHARIFRILSILFDLCIVVVSFSFGYFLIYNAYDIELLSGHIEIFPLLVVIWTVTLYFSGIYESFRISPTYEILANIFKSSLIGFVIFSSITYVFKMSFISREFTIFVFIFPALLISLEKILAVIFFRYIRKKGINYRRILIVGTNKRAQRFIDLVTMHAEWGLKIVGLVDEDKDKKGQLVNGYKVIGCFEDMPEIINNIVVDEVVFVVPRSWLSRIEDIINLCETEGLKIHLAVDYFELKFSRAKQTDLEGFPLLTFESTPDRLSHLLIKRLFDIVISGLGLIILSPFFLVITILIKTTSEGPVFFRQERCGLNGRRFTLYKFRTMVKGAEEKLKDFLAYNEMQGPAFKMANDPRVTKIGRFLRRTSFDEFPQLWNAFKGDMSIVGPRPPLPSEVKRYDSWHRRRLSMRPGITCLWQVNGRNKINDFDDWVKLDVKYIEDWSLWLDTKIILKTLPAVIFGKGAK